MRRSTFAMFAVLASLAALLLVALFITPPTEGIPVQQPHFPQVTRTVTTVIMPEDLDRVGN